MTTNYHAKHSLTILIGVKQHSHFWNDKKVEELLVEFHNIFATHRFDIGTNSEFKVNLRRLDIFCGIQEIYN